MSSIIFGLCLFRSPEPVTVAAYSEPVTPAYSNRRNKTPRHGFNKPQSAPAILQQVSSQSSANDSNQSRRFKPKIFASTVDANGQQTSSLYKFKLNRTPGRWQYKTSPKPRVTIRKQNSKGDAINEHTLPTPSNEPGIDAITHEELNEAQIHNPIVDDQTSNSRSDEADLDSSSSVNGDVLNDDDDTLYNVIENRKLLIETLKVEISTPANFKDTYYEIATIKSPYTFQVRSHRMRISFIFRCPLVELFQNWFYNCRWARWEILASLPSPPPLRRSWSPSQQVQLPSMAHWPRTF